MEAKKVKNKILIELSNEEALVFLNWLFIFNEKKQSDLFQDQSEERVLWDIESILESVMDETFDKDYKEIVSKAWEKIRD